MSAGQAVDEPAHVSTGSHESTDARHTVADAAVTVPQVPSVAAPAAILHAWQSLVPPAQVVLQHTSSTQLPLLH